MNPQMRKRSSVVYFWALVVTAGMLMTAIAQTSTGAGREYTADDDFDEGVLVGVEHETVHDQLQLSEEHVTLPFIWVPNNNATVSKVHTETGDELGRYWVEPPCLPIPENGSPSRTTVDLEGSCWVGNRAAGTVVKIGLHEAGNWIDRNADGICQTSQDTNGDGDITGDELLPWGEDECVLYEVVLIPGLEGTYTPGTFRCDPSLLAWRPTGGVFGGALNFDGTGQHVVNEGIEAYLNGLGALTIGIWCKSNVTGTDSGSLICTDPDGSDARDIRYDEQGGMSGRDNVIKCGITSTEGKHEVESSEGVQTTVWQHIAMTWQSGQPVKLYIDGQLDDSFTNQPTRGGTLEGYTKLIVGKGGKDTGDTGWWGLIDDVAIFSRALDATEISQLNDLGGGSFISDPGLLVLWEFDESSGLTASDSSGNGHIGTLTDFYPCVPTEPPVWQPSGGIIDGALDFDGVDDYVETGKVASDLGIGGNAPKTVTAWVNTRSFNGGGIFEVGRHTAGQDFSLRTLGTDVYGGDDWWRVQFWGVYDIDFTYPSKDVWVHLALVHDGSRSKLYADGALIVDEARTLNTADTKTFKIGRWNNEYFDGIIDDARIYNYAMDESALPVVMGGGEPELPKAARAPSPRDGAKNVFAGVILSWSPGDGVESHDVYFGTDNPPTTLISSQTGTTYDPDLDPDTTYYWQIVEQPGGYAGPVWSFTTVSPDTATGTILREVWTGIGGTSVSDLTSNPDYPDNPTFSDELPSFEAPTDWGSDYGTRINGYLHPQIGGDYTFWIASDDSSELWLSTDGSPENAVLIAGVSGWTTSRQWDKYASQQSDPVSLAGGQKYYIMAVYKEGDGGDNLAVAWQGPDQPQAPVFGSDNAIVAGSYLSPSPVTAVTPALPDPPTVVAHWKLDETSGTTASDNSGNGNHGVLEPLYDISLYDNDSWSTSPRGLAIDADNNLWAGTYLSTNYYHIDGATGTILKTVDVSPWNHHAYGAVIDKNGILWSAGHEPPNLLRMDPSTESISTVPIDHEHVYGLGLDYLDHLFVSSWTWEKLSRVDTLGAGVEWTHIQPELYEARGVACTSDNDVWVATTGPGFIYRYDNDGNPLIPEGIYVGSPTGVAVDAAGKVWTCNLNDDYIKRIDPGTNTVDLEKQIIGSGGHYSYSDMTGIMARTITTRIGTWTVLYDSEVEDQAWGVVSWSSSEPAGTSITVKVRSSSDQATWSAWETTENGIDLQQTPCGRYLQIETTLQIVSGDVSPILYDLVVLPSYTAVTYDGDTLVSTGGAPTATAELTASLRDEEGEVFDIDGIEMTFTLSAEGRDDIVVVAESLDGIATVESPLLEPDIYSIEVTVECASASALLAVYNPEGGFATGGGWIVPQDDGLNTYPNQRANFGFNAKYKQDAATGHLEFRYSDGYMDLKSSSIERLVITGGKIAMFKGWASVNKEQGHWFFVKAIDNGEPGINDAFDIKVWAPGIDTEGDPTERAGGVLQGGNIVVHTK